jgi:hypothetical protein
VDAVGWTRFRAVYERAECASEGGAAGAVGAVGVGGVVGAIVGGAVGGAVGAIVVGGVVGVTEGGVCGDVDDEVVEVGEDEDEEEEEEEDEGEVDFDPCRAEQAQEQEGQGEGEGEGASDDVGTEVASPCSLDSAVRAPSPVRLPPAASARHDDDIPQWMWDEMVTISVDYGKLLKAVRDEAAAEQETFQNCVQVRCARERDAAAVQLRAAQTQHAAELEECRARLLAAQQQHAVELADCQAKLREVQARDASKARQLAAIESLVSQHR